MTWDDVGIDIRGKRAGNVKTKCPKCGGKNDLSVNVTEEVWKCHKPSCAWTGTLKERRVKEEPYVRPESVNITQLDDNIVKWFKERGIGQDTLLAMKITGGEEWMPQPNKKVNTVQFHYFRNGELVNTKFRDGNKNFKLVTGAELIFYNLDGIKDENEIVIVEGEMDALAYIEAGVQNVVSVPNGASENPNLIYLDNCVEYFEGDKKIYLAIDKDNAGLHLQDKLLKRLDSDRCYEVNLKDCKDANEFLLKYGKLELADTIKNAKQFPLKGVIYANDVREEFNDLYEHGLQKGKLINIDDIDNLMSYEPGMQTTITGIPSHGKSYWLDFVLTRLSILHGWKTAMFSPEHHPLKLHIASIAEKIIGKPFSGGAKMNYKEKDSALEYMHNNFFFIRPDDENFSLDTILSLSKSLILRRGIQAIVIDPWNRIEHQMERGENETQYIGRQLDKITNFKQKYNIHIFLVAHPTKIKKDKVTGIYEVPTMYDIAGSSHFYNKADVGVCVYRNFNEERVQIHVQKMKYRHIGQMGMVEFLFNKTNGRFTPINSFSDVSNYLIEPPEKQIIKTDELGYPQYPETADAPF